jgi:hypothetical protein
VATNLPTGELSPKTATLISSISRQPCCVRRQTLIWRISQQQWHESLITCGFNKRRIDPVLNILLLTHEALCILAICSGSLVLSDLLAKRLDCRRVVWLLRFSLGADLAVLLSQFHDLLPTQKVAMLSVYIAGVIVFAWRAFHLYGMWRYVFAFMLPVVLYLDTLALSIQVFNHMAALEGFGVSNFRIVQILLLTVFVALGAVAATRSSSVITT